MENINQSLTNQQEFSGYLKDPGGISIGDEKTIKSLIERFPYAQMLHAFEAKCHSGDDNSDTYLEKAALYIPERSILYNIIHNPESFLTSATEKSEISREAFGIISEEDYSETITQENNVEQDNLTTFSAQTETEEYSIPAEITVEETSDNPEEAISSDPEKSELVEEGESEFEHDIIENPEAESFVRPEFEEQPKDEETETVKNEINEDFQPVAFSSDIEDTEDNELQSHISEEDKIVTEDQTDDADPSEESADETEKLILSNIAASDFFRFEEKIDDQLTPHQDTEYPHKSLSETRESGATDSNSAKGVSKYDDDKMPYTFLWWLNKTRKEHSATYQPYVNFTLDTTEDIKKAPEAELNQQIIENIFHLQSPLEDTKEDEKPKTVEFTVKRKDEQIIEKFIREEPQIRPPKPEKLDTENKARKSSEDSYDMVSETLANVYIEQMLFHKAIDTYKKLSLKFPEKSAYFADQIRKLETTN